MSGAPTHYAAGAVAGLAVAQLGVWAGATSPREAVGIATVATLTSGGILSPDVDQFRVWRRLDRWLPDELLGAGGPLQHRGITHWWGTTVLITVALLTVLGLTPLWWVALGQAAGWTSHLALDYVFGRTVTTPRGIVVRAGLPTILWFRHRGGWLTSGGVTSRAAGAALGVLALVQSAYLIASGGLP